MTKVYHRRKTDANQNEIVKAFIQMGYSVAVTNMGSGFPDLVIARNGSDGILVEIKNLNGRGNRLTKDQQKFHTSWKGRIYVIETVEQAIEVFA
jgi:hypothetical protein